MYNTLSQNYTLLVYLYAGLLLGVSYDLARLLRLLADRKLVTHASDLLFVLCMGAICYCAFQLGDSGKPRFYGLLLMVAGAVIQQWAFGRAICKRIVKRRA